jgi:glycosyltransferase involved in cell wall biosynthesis
MFQLLEIFRRGFRVLFKEGPKSFIFKFIDWSRRKSSKILIRSIVSSSLYSLPKTKNTPLHPKISVIVPCYNHASYLKQRLDSIYQQTYQNIEVILLDDASADNSTGILEEYRQKYPDKTRCYFNANNSGSVFHQWKKGIELAKGDLVWIAESDDYCTDNFLKELVKYFANEAVMLAFCRTVFVEDDTTKQIWSLEEYLARSVNPSFWNKPFIRSANQLVNLAWAINNIVPNVSSVVFRNPGKLALLDDNNWKNMRICGDWIFYLHIIRGGLVAYSPTATNYFRQHKNNTSVETHKKDIYYREHEVVAKVLVELYRLEDDTLEKQRKALESDWRLIHPDLPISALSTLYDVRHINSNFNKRKPNILMAGYAFAAGGGETFPIKLANLLKKAGYGITFINCHLEPTEPGIRDMLNKDIPLLELYRLDKLDNVVNDFGIDIVHSHHASVDLMICDLLKININCKVVFNSHGMYEMMPASQFKGILPLIDKRVSKIIYAADKNLEVFTSSPMYPDRFIKINNALEDIPINPVSRKELNINEEDFVLCLVSRAIPEKGWEEGIEAVRLARNLCGKEIHLLLIGEGPEYVRLKHIVNYSYIHFLGFKKNIRDYFAASNMGFLPSRFPGESFPLVIIDSLKSGSPVLASDIGEISNMLKTESGLAGSVFSLKKWKIPTQEVAEIISKYVTDQDYYQEHLKLSEKAAKKFDPVEMLAKYENMYKEILSDN